MSPTRDAGGRKAVLFSINEFLRSAPPKTLEEYETEHGLLMGLLTSVKGHLETPDAGGRAARNNNITRCQARSPGGMTADGRLPRKGTRCGNYAGHDDEHTVLIPTGAPWWPKSKPETNR